MKRAGKPKPTPTRKTSLYRLRVTTAPEHEELREFVVEKYLDRDGFTSHAVDLQGTSGLVVTGTIAPGDADWCRTLSRLTGLPISEENRTSLGLLLVRTEVAVYGLTYGMGHLLVDPARIDPGFGIGFAVRCLDEERITKVRRQIMDTRGRMDENSATGGEHISGFGIEQFGEIVSQIAGQIEDVPLTFSRERNRAAHLTGSDRSLKLHLGATPAALLHDLREIEAVCARPDPVPALGFIAQVRPLKPADERVGRLDEQLDLLLGADNAQQVALGVPGECRDRYDFAESFSVAVGGRAEQMPELDIDDLFARLRDKPDGQRLQVLRNGRIQMFADADGADIISRALAADQWLTAEIADGAVRYFYWQGQWYEIGAEYLTVIEERIGELLGRPSTVALPPWRDGEDEAQYNKRVAEQGGYVLLDQRTVHTARFRGGGLEIADVLGPTGELICIKKASKTAPLNHLFAQGRAAVETLRFDTEARAKLAAKIPDDHPADRTFPTPTIVYGVLLKDGMALTADSLFAFAKVSLLQAATALDGMGARLEIVSIARSDPDERTS